MTKNLLKKLTLNALNHLAIRLSFDSCSDLLKSDPLLENVSKEEFEIIQKEWIKKCPKLAKEYNNKMLFNHFIVDLLIKKYE